MKDQFLIIYKIIIMKEMKQEIKEMAAEFLDFYDDLPYDKVLKEAVFGNFVQFMDKLYHDEKYYEEFERNIMDY